MRGWGDWVVRKRMVISCRMRFLGRGSYCHVVIGVGSVLSGGAMSMELRTPCCIPGFDMKTLISNYCSNVCMAFDVSW